MMSSICIDLKIYCWTLISNQLQFFWYWWSISYHTSFPPQELTEEGLPFVVLFHHPEDLNSVRVYKEKVAAELMPETSEPHPLLARVSYIMLL